MSDHAAPAVDRASRLWAEDLLAMVPSSHQPAVPVESFQESRRFMQLVDEGEERSSDASSAGGLSSCSFSAPSSCETSANGDDADGLVGRGRG